MKKEIIKRSLLGALISLVVSEAITLMISVIIGNGTYYPVVPELVEVFGTELNAVLVQTIVNLLYGAMFGGTSLIWEVEHWSLLRQTVTHFLAVTLTTLPVAYFMRWMSPGIAGVLIYMGTFVGIYAVIWISIYLSILTKLKKINTKVGNRSI